MTFHSTKNHTTFNSNVFLFLNLRFNYILRTYLLFNPSNASFNSNSFPEFVTEPYFTNAFVIVKEEKWTVSSQYTLLKANAQIQNDFLIEMNRWKCLCPWLKKIAVNVYGWWIMAHITRLLYLQVLSLAMAGSWEIHWQIVWPWIILLQYFYDVWDIPIASVTIQLRT